MSDVGMGGQGVSGERVVVTRVSSRMAPAHAGRVGPGASSRTLFAAGRLTWKSREIRLVESGQNLPVRGIPAGETVH